MTTKVHIFPHSTNYLQKKYGFFFLCYLCSMKRTMLVIIALYVAWGCHAQKTYHGDGPDDILRWIPLAGAVGLKAGGVEARSDWAHFALNAALSTAVTAVTTYSLKQVVREERPDGTDVHSFPSGHSSIAFAGAHVLFKEFHQRQPWICVVGYAVASYTAVDRVCRNRHRWGDVAAGAAIGILSTELSYWLGSKILKNTDDHVQVAWSPVGVQVKLSLP